MIQDPYNTIAAKLDQHAAGVPKRGDEFSPAFMSYLKLLYTPQEAELVQFLDIPREILPDSFDPSLYRTAASVARLAGKDVISAKEVLDNLVFRNRLLSSNIFANASFGRKAKRLILTVKTFRSALGTWGSLQRAGKIAGKVITEAIENGLLSKGAFSISLYALPYFPVLLNVHQLYEHIEPEDLQAADMYQKFFIKDKYYKNYEGSAKGRPM